MKRQVKTMIVVAAATLATLAGSITPAVACGGRGGGGYGFGGYARTSYRPSYRPNSYAPSYQPRYSQPVYNQTQYGFNQSASVINQPVRQITRPQSIPQQTLRQPVQPQQLAQPQRTVQQQPSQRQPVQQASARRQTQTTPPTNQLTSAANNAARQTAATTASANAETSALKMLRSLGTKPAQTTPTTTATSAAIPQFSPAPTANDQAHVGTWKVNLPNSQSVQLALQADGKFVWTAVSKGNRRSFNGQYRMDNNRLTLVRANDLQQMTGSWTGNTNQFTFKLDGAKNGGLNFKRS